TTLRVAHMPTGPTATPRTLRQSTRVHKNGVQSTNSHTRWTEKRVPATTAENVVPMFCLPGKGAPVHQTWNLPHRYKSSGRYKVSLTVYVNCTSDRVMANITVIII
ncbi:MAG: hypothetical protein ACHQE6_04790, partial [Solirubrobacterales bacterium]